MTEIEISPTTVKLFNSIRVGGKQYTFIDINKPHMNHIKIEVTGEWLIFTCKKSGMITFSRANNVIEMIREGASTSEQSNDQAETKSIVRRGRQASQITA